MMMMMSASTASVDICLGNLAIIFRQTLVHPGREYLWPFFSSPSPGNEKSSLTPCNTTY